MDFRSGLAALLSRTIGISDREAAEALQKAGSISALLEADRLELEALDIAPATIARIEPMRAFMLAVLREPLSTGALHCGSGRLLNYLRMLLGHARIEMLLVLYLDGSLRLIADEVASVGSTHEVAIYPNSIARRALELRASGLIMAHNHPSGRVAPSGADIERTRALVAATSVLDIQLVDHVIIAGNSTFSFRAEGLL